MKNILLVFGTRPEAIKLAPLYKKLLLTPDFNTQVCVTAQHREMLDQVLSLFQIEPKYDLDIMGKTQTLEDITTKVLIGVSEVLNDFNADGVIVHGDTTTTFATTLAAFYKKIPVFHVEAGLRTNDIYSPWPEEANRRISDALSSFYFPPTLMAKNNLINEGVQKENILVTGNTVIDALLYVGKLLDSDKKLEQKQRLEFSMLDFNKRIVLITGHRRESFGAPFRNFCSAIRALAIQFPDDQFVYPVHLNPNVRKPVGELLNDLSNVFLLEPLEYLNFVYLMKNSYLIITDSGGIQEEAPSFSIPVLITRDKTERPEAVTAGIAKLVGTNPNVIISQVSKLLTNEKHYKKMKASENPFGDGKASEYICQSLTKYYSPKSIISNAREKLKPQSANARIN